MNSTPKIPGQKAGVALLLRSVDGKVFLQQRDSGARVSPLEYGFWGGAIDSGETPEEAAVRELYEELAVSTAIHPLGRRHEMLLQNDELGEFKTYLFEVEGYFTWRNVTLGLEGAGAAFFTPKEVFKVKNLGLMAGLWLLHLERDGVI